LPRKIVDKEDLKIKQTLFNRLASYIKNMLLHNYI
jgi:hypothetical protein